MATDVERIVEEYVRVKGAVDSMSARAEELKKMLSNVLMQQGDEDEKGNRWMNAGRFLLQRQRRQKPPSFNKDAAEKWAKKNGLWDDLKKVIVTEEVDEDALVGYVFLHPEHEDSLRDLYTVPEPTWAFLSPQEVEQYDT